MDPKPGHVVIIDNASIDDTTELVESFRDRLGTRARLPPPGDEHRRLRRLQRGHARRVRARLDVDLAHGRRRRGPPERPRPDGRLGAAVQEHPGPPLRLRRQRVLLAVPGRRAARHPDPVRPGRLRRVRLQADELRMLRGHVHPPRHRRSRSACPIPRFFIYWDDQMYGWLASRKTTSVIVNEFVLRRTREIKQWDMGIRHMNASSNAYRYYIMRNRGHMKNYYRSLGVYNPVLFGARHGAHVRQGAHPAARRGAHRAGHVEPLPRPPRRAQDREGCRRGGRCRRWWPRRPEPNPPRRIRSAPHAIMD